MLSTENPIKGHLLPRDIDRRPLVPQRYNMRNGKVINYFVSDDIGLIKMDFIFEAGSALQDKPVQAAAAINLLTEGTTRHTSKEIADFLDFRGIIVEKSNDEVSSTLTLYAMPRYIGELLPLLREMLTEPTYPEVEFGVFVAKRRQQLLVNLQRTGFVARKRWCESLYGIGHPQAVFATLADLEQLTVEDVRAYHRNRLTPSRLAIVLGGAVSKEVLNEFDVVETVERTVLPEPKSDPGGRYDVAVEGAVQNTLRVGRLLPMQWNDREYAEFMVLSTALGGYFGSRLMTNIREDKGYTYGIGAMTQISRGSLSLIITSDVAADKVEPALQEIKYELERLRREPMSDEELELVRTCMLGDFMRSVDGVFERSERFCQLLTSGVDERFTDNYMSVLEPGAITPRRLQELAWRLLDWSEMSVVSAGVV